MSDAADTHLWEFRAEDFVFARLDDEHAATQAMASDADRDAALHWIDCLRLVAAMHCIYVDRDGKDWCRCFTCHPSCGVPCVTILRLARIWRDHPDYSPAWNETVDHSSTWAARADVERARVGGFRKLHLQSIEAQTVTRRVE